VCPFLSLLIPRRFFKFGTTWGLRSLSSGTMLMKCDKCEEEVFYETTTKNTSGVGSGTTDANKSLTAICFLMPPDQKDAQVCLLHKANLTRSGTLGKGLKVDWYTERGTDGVHDFEFLATLESGSTELVVEERGMGFNRITGVSWYDSLQIFNIVTDPIDPKVFNVPQNCPL